jgi:hypothetical protein
MTSSAQEFYEKLGFKPIDCPNEYNELYYELDGVAAPNNVRAADQA